VTLSAVLIALVLLMASLLQSATASQCWQRAQAWESAYSESLQVKSLQQFQSQQSQFSIGNPTVPRLAWLQSPKLACPGTQETKLILEFPIFQKLCAPLEANLTPGAIATATNREGGHRLPTLRLYFEPLPPHRRSREEAIEPPLDRPLSNNTKLAIAAASTACFYDDALIRSLRAVMARRDC
jgi:hypothetical protein